MPIYFKNIAISFDDNGQGDAIVLLHGFLGNKKMWSFFRDEFQADFRIISVDLLGHGDTATLGYVQSMEENATMIEALLASLQIKKYAVIGHSMGGYVALELIKKQPLFVQKLVLLNSTALADTPDKITNRNRAIRVVKKDYETFVRLSIGNLFSDSNRDRLEKEIEFTKTEALQTPLQGIIASLEGMKTRHDNSDLFRNINIPKLLILGEKDTVLPFEDTANQIKNSTIQLIALSGGHMSHLENKEELLSIFKKFLK